jgi:hypothetical protein
VREKFIHAFLLSFENVGQAFVNLLSILLDEIIDSGLVESLVERGVFGIHINLPVGKLESLRRLLVKHDVKGNLCGFVRVEERVLLHFAP